MWGLPPLRWMLYPAGTASVLWLRESPYHELPWLCKVEGSEGGSCKASALAQLKERRQRRTCRSESSADLSICRADGPGRMVESRRPKGRVFKVFTTPPTNPHSNLPPQPVTEAPEVPIVTATGETAKPQKTGPKSTAAPKRAAGKSKKNVAASVKTAAATHTTPNLLVPTHSSTYTLERTSDLLDHLPLQACVKLKRRFFTSPPSPQGQFPRGLSSRPLFCLWPNLAARPKRTERCKDLRIACWKADGVRGRKLELEYFLNQRGVDNCLLSETFLNPGLALFPIMSATAHTDRQLGAVQPSWSVVV